jgi:uncharacterized low-complexity protein
MTSSNTRKTTTGVLGIALAGLALGGNAFAMQPLSQGYMVAAAHVGEEGKCGEGKCGADSKPAKTTAATKTAEGKCGEGQCGDARFNKADADDDGLVSKAEYLAVRPDGAGWADKDTDREDSSPSVRPTTTSRPATKPTAGSSRSAASPRFLSNPPVPSLAPLGSDRGVPTEIMIMRTIESSTSAGLGLRRGLLPSLLAMDDRAVDFLEVAPDNWIRRWRQIRRTTRAAGHAFPDHRSRPVAVARRHRAAGHGPAEAHA